MRQTKIVGTIGPASQDPAVFQRLVEAGLDVVRFNFSHGDHQTHNKNMDMVKKLRRELDRPLAILLDTKGPEIRIKTMKDLTFLKDGSSFILAPGDFLGDESRAPITYEGFAHDVEAGGRILISDGKIVLKVEKIIGSEIHTIVEHGGELKTRKGVNAPGIRVNLPAVTEQDVKDILFGIEQDVDFIAPSFIRKAQDVLEVRKILEEHNASHIQIISKIENHEGLMNLEEILEVSDGIMVARGDLGMEMPIEAVPVAQKQMIRRANFYGKPVITATQMLESMTTSPLPTRAEASDVANAIIDGTDAIMLSGEMAAGSFPVESVEMMHRIALMTESGIDVKTQLLSESHAQIDSVTYALGRATVEAATNLGAKAILTATTSGFTARKIAMHRPKSPIVAATTNERVRRQLSLVRGVRPMIMETPEHLEGLIHELESAAKKTGLVSEGDLVVITFGLPLGVSGATNMMKVQIIGEVMLKGTGIGKGKHSGRLRLIDHDPEDFKDGDIILTEAVDASNLELLKRAGALITVEGGYTSSGAIAAINLGIPTIVGVEAAGRYLKHGMTVTVDARLGIIYNGQKEL